MYVCFMYVCLYVCMNVYLLICCCTHENDVSMCVVGGRVQLHPWQHDQEAAGRGAVPFADVCTRQTDLCGLNIRSKPLHCPHRSSAVTLSGTLISFVDALSHSIGPHPTHPPIPPSLHPSIHHLTAHPFIRPFIPPPSDHPAIHMW